MAVEIVMPRLSDSMEEGTVLQWFIAEGDAVAEGEPLVEVETDKASVTYESEVDGTVLSITVPAGGSAAVGAVIALIGEPGETGRAEAATAARVKASPLARRVAAERLAGVTLPSAGTVPVRRGRAPRHRYLQGLPRLRAHFRHGDCPR